MNFVMDKDMPSKIRTDVVLSDLSLIHIFPPFAPGTTEFPLPESTFDAAPNGYTFNEWTFNLGYMNQMDLPTGKVEVPGGTFYGDVKAYSTSVDADLLSGGKMTVKRSDGGEYTISGTLVGDLSLKRYFTYTGKLTTIDRHESTEETPKMCIRDRLTTTPRSVLPKAILSV